MAYYKQLPSSSSSDSSNYDSSVSLVNKRIKMEDSKTVGAVSPSTGNNNLLFVTDAADGSDARTTHVAVHVSKSDSSRSHQAHFVSGKASAGSQSLLDADASTSQASPKSIQVFDGPVRARQNIAKKKLLKTSDITSRESPQRDIVAASDDPQRSEVEKFNEPEKTKDAVDGCFSLNTPVHTDQCVDLPPTASQKCIKETLSELRSRLRENSSMTTALSDVTTYSHPPSSTSCNRSQQPFHMSSGHHATPATTSNISILAASNNMDIGVDMDLPSPPNEESQQSESRSPSGAGMDETFSEAPHPTPGPIQDTDMDCVDGEDGFPSASIPQKSSLLSSAAALVRDCSNNRSRLSSPLTLNGIQDGQNPLAKVLSHDSQWMLQYLQPFTTDSCSSTCTDGNEYFMPDNVRSQLTMIARMSDEDRSTFLDHLIWSSPMRQLHHIKALLDPIFTRDFVGALPRDVALHVLSYLDPVDLGRCARVSRLWRVICEDNLLWQVKCQEAGHLSDTFTGMRVPMRSLTAAAPPNVLASAIKNRPPSVSESHASGLLDELGYGFKNSYGSKASSRNSNCGDGLQNYMQIGASAHQQHQTHHGPPQPFVSSWKQTYRYHSQTERNWRTGQHIYPLELYNHGRNFITSMVIAGERVLTGSEDTTVRVVELGNVSEIAAGRQAPREVRCHSNGVWALAADDGLCVSGGTDRTISVVDLITGQQITQLRGHTSTVRCLALKNDICVSGSRDNSLRVWAARTGTCLFTLNGHGASVRCVCFDGTTIVSGSYDASVRVWNADDGKQRHELVGHTGRIYCLEFDGERIVSGCLNSLIIVWNAATGERVYELHGHNSLISALKLSGETLISGGADSVVRVWNLSDRNQDLQMYVGQGKHSSAITAIHIGRTYFVTSSDDGYVKLWDLRTGNFIRNLMKFDEAADMGVVWRIVATDNKLICACGHRARMTDSKVLLLDFDAREQIESDLLLKPSTTSATPPPASSAAAVANAHQQQQMLGVGNAGLNVSPSTGSNSHTPSASGLFPAMNNSGVGGGSASFFGGAHTLAAGGAASLPRSNNNLWTNYNAVGGRGVGNIGGGPAANSVGISNLSINQQQQPPLPRIARNYQTLLAGFSANNNNNSLLSSFSAASGDGAGGSSSSAASAANPAAVVGSRFIGVVGAPPHSAGRCRVNAGGARYALGRNAINAAVTDVHAGQQALVEAAADDTIDMQNGAGDNNNSKSQRDAGMAPANSDSINSSTSFASTSVCIVDPLLLAPQPLGGSIAPAVAAVSNVRGGGGANSDSGNTFPRKPSSSLAPGAERSS